MSRKLSLELGTTKYVNTEVSRYGSAGAWRAHETCFENLPENGDVNHSETLRILNKKVDTISVEPFIRNERYC